MQPDLIARRLMNLEVLIESGHIIDLVLGLVVFEAIVLLLYRKRTMQGIAAPDLLIGLAPGACLMLALRAALMQFSWTWIALALTAALVCHVADMARRWRTAELKPAFNVAQSGTSPR